MSKPTLGFNLRNAWKGMGKEWEMAAGDRVFSLGRPLKSHEKRLSGLIVSIVSVTQKNSLKVLLCLRSVAGAHHPDIKQRQRHSERSSESEHSFSPSSESVISSSVCPSAPPPLIPRPESNSSSCHCLGVECRVQPPSFEVAVDDAAGHAPRPPLE
ncbi:unnamed protein product [Gadus morhua 'NCC']